MRRWVGRKEENPEEDEDDDATILICPFEQHTCTHIMDHKVLFLGVRGVLER
jgi:hypothetical protein